MKSNRLTYRLVAFSLALLVLLTSIGLHLDAHFCMGQLRSFSLFGKAKNCYELAEASTSRKCQMHTVQIADQFETQIQRKSCCSDYSQYYSSSQNKVSQQYQKESVRYSLKPLMLAYPPVFQSNSDQSNQPLLLIQDKIPKLSRDIYVYHQSFLL